MRYEQEQPQTMDRALEEFGVEAGNLPHPWAGCGAWLSAGGGVTHEARLFDGIPVALGGGMGKMGS